MWLKSLQNCQMSSVLVHDELQQVFLTTSCTIYEHKQTLPGNNLICHLIQSLQHYFLQKDHSPSQSVTKLYTYKILLPTPLQYLCMRRHYRTPSFTAMMLNPFTGWVYFLQSASFHYISTKTPTGLNLSNINFRHSPQRGFERNMFQMRLCFATTDWVYFIMYEFTHVYMWCCGQALCYPKPWRSKVTCYSSHRPYALL